MVIIALGNLFLELIDITEYGANMVSRLNIGH